MKSSLSPFTLEDNLWMRRAISEAQKAFEEDEVPIGAVLVAQSKLIAACHNQVERLSDATAHAEMLALSSGMTALGAKYLPQATLYITIEPCVMCMGAIRWSQIGRVVYGASEPHFGYQVLAPHSPHPSCLIEGGLLAEECKELMVQFFKSKRKTRR